MGDGPWDLMHQFDDELPQRKFDNFHFVPFNEVMARAENRDVSFALAALSEVSLINLIFNSIHTSFFFFFERFLNSII